ncbi:E3 ubiquitin-protein ligase RNF10-like [Halichondria panicea]|uniref:E3 ubiquitin-protein ligase RNF10-like n=1 Tax=Halichondria panicea TaxID=6063 RepID=UPI00312B2EAC
MATGGGTLRVPSYERQNTEDVADLPLKIPVSAVYEHFTCTVCMSRITDTCVTSCGHRFCFQCIEEWVSRKHKCPCCNTVLNATDLIKDVGFDALIRTVREERTKAEKEYFKVLVEKASNAPFKGETLDSPLQVVLQKHLKQSLQQHEAYHQRLVADYKRGLSKLAQEKHIQAQLAIQQYPHDPDHPGRRALLDVVERRWEEKKTVLAGELERVEKLLASAYDRHLSQHLPRSPATVPVSVQLSVPDRDFIARDVVLLPEDTMATVLGKLRGLMEGAELEVETFPACEELELSIISPFAPLDDEAPPSPPAGDEDAPGLKAAGGDMTLVSQVVHPDCRPVLEFDMTPGTELRFKGDIVLVGDTPTTCFAAGFAKGQEKFVDYFTCQQCNLNWICKACSEVCHKGHGIVPFNMNHKTTWACCYCLRKKKCTISQKLK